MYHSLIGTTALLGAVSDYIPFLDDGIDLIIAGVIIISSPIIWQFIPTKKHKAEELRRLKVLKELDGEEEIAIQEIAKKRNVNLEKAKAIYTAKSRCPKCGDIEAYGQPVTISKRVGFRTIHKTYNVPFCKSCNVEFVPRVLE